MNETKKSGRKIPVKNYVTLGIISVFTIVLVFYLVNVYKDRVKYNNETDNVMTFLSEIKEDELSNYISENHDTMIYISSVDHVQNRNYERNLKKYITKKGLSKDMVYLNVTDLDVDFLNYLKNNYFDNKLKNTYEGTIAVPNILVVKEERIIKVLNKEQSKLDINKTKSFIKEQWIDD